MGVGARAALPLPLDCWGGGIDSDCVMEWEVAVSPVAPVLPLRWSWLRLTRFTAAVPECKECSLGHWHFLTPTILTLALSLTITLP